MIAPDRDRAPRRRVDEQDRRRLPRANCVEQVQLEAKKIVGSKRRREDYVEIGHIENYSRWVKPSTACPEFGAERSVRIWKTASPPALLTGPREDLMSEITGAELLLRCLVAEGVKF